MQRNRAIRLRIEVYSLCVLAAVAVGLHGLGVFKPDEPRNFPPASRTITEKSFQQWVQSSRTIEEFQLNGLSIYFSQDDRFPAAFITDDLRDIMRPMAFWLLFQQTDVSYPYRPAITNNRPFAVLRRPQSLYNSLKLGILSHEGLHSLGLDKESIAVKLGEAPQDEVRSLFTVNTIALQSADESRAYAALYRQRFWCFRQLGILDLMDVDGIADMFSSFQILPGTERARERSDIIGLIRYKREPDVFVSTYTALSILADLGELDRVDRERCVEGILRHYGGDGQFRGDDVAAQLRFSGEYNRFCAMESLHILDALDRIGDLDTWEFPAHMTDVGSDGQRVDGIGWSTYRSWSYQLRLEALRAELDPTSGTAEPT